MFYRLTPAFLRLSTIAILSTVVGCDGWITEFTSPTEGQYHGFFTSAAWIVGSASQRSAAAATNTPELLIGEPAGTGTKAGTGTAYVYGKSATSWSPVKSIFDANAPGRQGFGQSMSVKGNDVIVGAPLATSFAGSAFVFVRSGNTWTQQGELKASDAAANDQFGSAVAIHGNIAMVSAPFEDQNGTNAGAVYTFARSGTTWTQTQKLMAAIPDANDNFGIAVLLDGSEALISSYDDSAAYPLPSGGGRVHLWSLTGGVWTEGPTLRPSDPTQYKAFGSSLARQGNWLVVGAIGDYQTASNAGAVYVFERVGTTWVERQKLLANDGTVSARFGNSVAIDGNYIVVGASNGNGKATQSGAAYVFELDGTWKFAGKLIASAGVTGDRFGTCVAVSGDQVAVGAPAATVQGFSFAGVGYVFTIPQYFGSQRILTEARHFAFGRK